MPGNTLESDPVTSAQRPLHPHFPEENVQVRAGMSRSRSPDSTVPEERRTNKEIAVSKQLAAFAAGVPRKVTSAPNLGFVSQNWTVTFWLC